MLQILAIVLLPPLLMLALGFAAARASQQPVEVGLADGRLRPCPRKPNCVCSEPGTDEEHAIAPLRFDCAPDVAFRSLVDFVATESNAKLLRATDDYAHAVYWTAFFHFADDVELRLDREAGVVHVRSAARIGHSDLGQNRRRIESLRARWRPPAPAEPVEPAAPASDG